MLIVLGSGALGIAYNDALPGLGLTRDVQEMRRKLNRIILFVFGSVAIVAGVAQIVQALA